MHYEEESAIINGITEQTKNIMTSPMIHLNRRSSTAFMQSILSYMCFSILLICFSILSILCSRLFLTNSSRSSVFCSSFANRSMIVRSSSSLGIFKSTSSHARIASGLYARYNFLHLRAGLRAFCPSQVRLLGYQSLNRVL